MIVVPQQLYFTHIMCSALDCSALGISPFCWCSSEAPHKVSLAHANTLLPVFQGKLGVPGLPGYPGRQGPKVTRWVRSGGGPGGAGSTADPGRAVVVDGATLRAQPR